MTVLTNLRERFSGHAASPGDPQASSSDEARPPFSGYDRLGNREVIDELHDHSQVELESIETYERSHENREPVLNKLRYMRQPEPMAGYDALSTDEIVAALQQADGATIKKVRGYERKFGNRPDVLDEVGVVHHRDLELNPPAPMPSYDPASGPSTTS